jgi:hypothetical protein
MVTLVSDYGVFMVIFCDLWSLQNNPFGAPPQARRASGCRGQASFSGSVVQLVSGLSVAFRERMMVGRGGGDMKVRLTEGMWILRLARN